jgi:hypothetical protein
VGYFFCLSLPNQLNNYIMANPLIHSQSSVKRWGGKVEDYLPIHELIDSPKACMNNNSSRLVTHNVWFCYNIIPKIFGYNLINSNGKRVDTIDIAMLHVAEDFRHRFVPTLEDYLKHLELPAWIHNGVKDVENPIATKYADDLVAKLQEEEQ